MTTPKAIYNDPDSLLRGLQEKNLKLSIRTEDYKKLSEQLADAKRNYKIARAQKLTELKLKGESITLIPKLAEGDKAVADFEYIMNVAEGVYKACREGMDNDRTGIDSYRSMLSWLKTELHEQK